MAELGLNPAQLGVHPVLPGRQRLLLLLQAASFEAYRALTCVRAVANAFCARVCAFCTWVCSVVSLPCSVVSSPRICATWYW